MTVTSAGLYIRLALHFTPYFAKPFVRRLLRLVITL